MPEPLKYKLEDLNSKDFWQDFADPGFHINKEDLQDKVIINKSLDIDDELFKKEGYLHLKEGFNIDFDKYTNFLKKMHEFDLPCVFAFVYDEFWQMHNQLIHHVNHFLDDDSRLIPSPWIWYVDSDKEKALLDQSLGGNKNQEIKTRSIFSGFYGPHRDKGKKALFEDGSPKILSFWLPLSEASPLNSCIYIVPADKDPSYNTEEETSWSFSRTDIRALPAEPGDILFWNEAVVHWGSRPANRKNLKPRISIGFEYIKSNFKETCYPNYKFGYYPDFQTRLAVIATQFRLYLSESGFPEIFIDFIKANDSIIKDSAEIL